MTLESLTRKGEIKLSSQGEGCRVLGSFGGLKDRSTLERAVTREPERIELLVTKAREKSCQLLRLKKRGRESRWEGDQVSDSLPEMGTWEENGGP